MEPNIAIIVIDALRADRVGVVGGKNITPNIDDLSDSSATFTNAFSTSNATDAAITSLQTGRYPLSHGIVNHGSKVTDREKRLIEKVPRLPEVLSDAGYQTAAFGRSLGRWHRKGFDKYPDATGSESNTVKRKLGRILQSIHPSVHDVSSIVYDGAFNKENSIKTSRVVDDSVDAFEAVIDESDRFYSFFHTMHTHTTYEADPDLVKRYLERFDYEVRPFSESVLAVDPIPQSFHEAIKNDEYPGIKEKYYYSDMEPSTAVAEAHYDAATTEADQYVGRIIDVLKSNDIFDDTLVIILSDHGESMFEHGIYFDHHGLYDESVRIPLVVHPPEGDNDEFDEFVQITDIAPTVADYAGLDELDTNGRSLKPLLEKNEEFDRPSVMAEEAHTQRRRMIRTKEEKLIYLLEGDTICEYCDVQHAPSEELYELVNDPNEVENTIETNSNRASELRTTAEDAARSYREHSVETERDTDVEYEDEEEVLDRLEALGYK